MSDRKPSVEALIKLADLRLDGGTQIRLNMRPDKIEEYAERMLAGDQFPLSDVFYDETNYWLADGFHRVGAAAKAGIQSTRVMLHYGTLRDAILFAIRSNSRHGIELTSEDKKEKILRLLQDKEWSLLSNRTLAEIARVSQSYFGKVKAELLGDDRLSKKTLYGQVAPQSVLKDIKKHVDSDMKQAIEEIADSLDNNFEVAKLTDEFGTDLPDKALAAFQDRPNYRTVRRHLRNAVSVIRNLAKQPGGKLLDHRQINAYLSKAMEKTYEAEPYAVCAVCSAGDPLCGRCHGDGWVSRMSFEGQKKGKKA